MITPNRERVIRLPLPAQPLRRRRSRLGEPTVYIEFVVVNGELGKQLLRKQAAAIREALQWFADHPPPSNKDRQDDPETRAQ